MQLDMSLYLKTQLSEIQTQINKIRNFITNNRVTSEKRRYAHNQVNACLMKIKEKEK